MTKLNLVLKVKFAIQETDLVEDPEDLLEILLCLLFCLSLYHQFHELLGVKLKTDNSEVGSWQLPKDGCTTMFRVNNLTGWAKFVKKIVGLKVCHC